MARPDRLFRLLQAMRMMPAPITAARLAAEMDVSLRSLYRDIDSLRAAGARIEGERGYGYRLVEDYALPPQTFDRTEIEAIALGLAEVRHMGDPALAEAAASVLAKVAATLPDDREQHLFHAISQVYRPDARYDPPPHLDLVRQACWSERALRIRYADKGNAVTERTILPLAIVYTDRALTVLAWCCLREAFRMFRLERITRIDDTATSFRPRRAALLRDYLAQLRAGEAKTAPAVNEPSNGALHPVPWMASLIHEATACGPRDAMTDTDHPSFRFDAEIIHWRGPSPYYFAPLPQPVAGEIAAVASRVSYGWGVIPVEARIGEVVFTTSLIPRDGTYLLPLKDAARRRLDIPASGLLTVEMSIRTRRP